MKKRTDITATDIRKSLIERAKAYAEAADTSFSAMSLAAVNDTKFLGRVENSSIGFNIKTYQKMVDWLDRAERKLSRGQKSDASDEARSGEVSA
jgi:hypothetical protein